jgi:hypothetical protein
VKCGDRDARRAVPGGGEGLDHEARDGTYRLDSYPEFTTQLIDG